MMKDVSVLRLSGILILLVALARNAAGRRANHRPDVFELGPALPGALKKVVSLVRRDRDGEPAVELNESNGSLEASFAVQGGTPGEFNLYIMAMIWNAEWCYHKDGYPGCEAPRSYWRENLTIHGLWPDYGDGTYPTYCTTEAYDHERVVAAVGLENLKNWWPNAQVSEDAGKQYDSLWEHEWDKHGTCTGLSQEIYFTTTVNLLKTYKTPPELRDNIGGQVTRAALEDAYGGEGMVVLECHGNAYLTQVMLCLEMDTVTGLPGRQIPCPGGVAAHDYSCYDDSLHITSF